MNAPVIVGQTPPQDRTPSIDHPGFYHLQAGELYGPFSPAQLRERVVRYQILNEDSIIFQPGEVILSGKTINEIGHLLQAEDIIEHVEPELIITRTGVLAKNRRVDFTAIERCELLLAQPPRTRVLRRMDKIGIWVIAILLVWTFVVPLTAWLLTKRTSDEEGLGSVNGIKLHGDFEEFIVCDSLGIFTEGSQELEHLRSLFGLLVCLHHQAKSPPATA